MLKHHQLDFSGLIFLYPRHNLALVLWIPSEQLDFWAHTIYQGSIPMLYNSPWQQVLVSCGDHTAGSLQHDLILYGPVQSPQGLVHAPALSPSGSFTHCSCTQLALSPGQPHGREWITLTLDRQQALSPFGDYFQTLISTDQRMRSREKVNCPWAQRTLECDLSLCHFVAISSSHTGFLLHSIFLLI